MCEIDKRRDMTKLEAYISDRPQHADVRIQAYSEWALDELLEDVITEMEKPPYYISGEEEIPITDIIDAFIEKMRYFRKIAKPGKKLMFNVAVKEAESLRLLFS